MSATPPPAAAAAPRRAGEPWAPGPRRPRLAAAAVHVWRADLLTAGDELGEALSEQERERAERFASERDARLWSRSRAVLRALLGRYLQADPSSIELVSEAQGKPRLAGGAGARAPGAGAQAPQLHFNLSHSGELALYAFSTAPVGVDVQRARERDDVRRGDRVALAARVFGAEQARALEALDPAVREREFLRLWTRHEAELKRRGTGLAGASELCERSARSGEGATGGEPSASDSTSDGDGGSGRSHVYELDVGPRAAAALATTLPAGELRRWEWA